MSMRLHLPLSTLLFCLALVLPVQAQWDRPVYLTRDNDHTYRWPCMVMDSLWRMHVFFIREQQGPAGQTSSLYYQRFDNWGQPLSQPQVLLADSHRQDFAPTVLLDRQQHLHVLWTRNYWYDWSDQWYTRLDLEGHVLTTPYRVLPVDDPHAVEEMHGFFLQQRSGLIWFVFGSRRALFNEAGELVDSLRPIPADLGIIMGGHPALSPEDEVWYLFRHVYNGPPHQDIAAVRLDTTGGHVEIISPSPGPTVQMSIHGFQVDSGGVFQMILYREDSGLFYARDPRNGSPPDTIVFDSSPYGIGTSVLTFTAPDTMEYLWGQTLPQPGFLRVGFNRAGERVMGPLFTRTSEFGLWDFYPITYRQGSYWVVGGARGRDMLTEQVAMLHIPGPEEPPPNSAEDRRSTTTVLPFRLYPNPTQGGPLYLEGPLSEVRRIVLYNVLGQTLFERTLPPQSVGPLVLPETRALPSGTYFLELQAAQEHRVQKVVIGR